MKRVTIEDVAAAAGVSRQTVSRAINDKGEISSETKERVLSAVQNLGYRPNRLAQGMVTQRTQTVGLVIPDINNLFFPEVARGVQDAARQHDYNAVLCNTDDNAAEEMRVLHSLAAQGVDGIILISSAAPDDELRQFADSFFPIVIVNRRFDHPNISSIMVDNERGAFLAVEHLIQTGHREIGMLANLHYSRSTVRRVRGYHAALARYGLATRDGYIWGGVPTLHGGYAALRQLLEKHPQLTAVFTFNDLMGLGAIRAAQDLGRHVPADLAVIGFDDIALAEVYIPSLSTVRVDKHALGRVAMRHILHMLNDDLTAYDETAFGVELVRRESTARW